MTFFVLASVQQAPPPAPRAVRDARQIWLESWDGSVKILIAAEYEASPWKLQTGAKGLRQPPKVVSTAALPGVAGSVVDGVSTSERAVLLPLSLRSVDQAEQWERIRELQDLTDPPAVPPADGSFRIVCASPSGTRQLGLVYLSGLEGDELGLTTYDRMVLSCVAPQPFAEDREERPVTFKAAAGVVPYLSATSGTSNPWGTRKLAATTVLAAETPVVMTSSVPVWPTFEIKGPVSSLLIESPAGLRVDVPGGLGSDETLTIVSDPRRKSIRLNGVAAAERLARGSMLVPFALGETLLEVDMVAPSTATELRISWRGLHGGLW